MYVYLKALGCRLNEAELEHWSREFQRDGFCLTQQAEKADLVILNTCAVTADAGRKSRQLIRRIQRQNPHAKLVVSGCYAALEPDTVAADLGADLVVDNAQKDRLVALTRDALALPAMPAAAIDSVPSALFSRGRSRAFIKVQDGCRYRCSFCIVTVARGAERSRTSAEIIAEINGQHDAGVQEAVLSGVHLGGYGSDCNSDLTGLLTEVLRETSIPRLRLGSLEPWDLPTSFFELFDNERLMPHLHLPLQSGSDAVLRRMARRCKTAAFADLIEQARRQITDFNVTTDVIVGFPGESEDDWRRSLAYIESTGFGHVHIFPYSPRSGTKAAQMSGPIDRPTKRRRAAELHALAQRMKQETLERFKGRIWPVLWESKDAEQRYWGYTPNYLRVALETAEEADLSHRIHPARLTDLTEDAGAALAELV